MARVEVQASAFDPEAGTITLGQAVPLDQLTSVRNLTTGEVLFLAEDYVSSPGSYRMVGNVLHLRELSDLNQRTDELEVLWETDGPIPNNGGNSWSSYAPLYNPRFVGTVQVQRLRLADGKGAEGKVLVSDDRGNARWDDVSATMPEADADSLGAIRLAGDLGGTADAPVVLGKAPLDSPSFTGTLSAPEIRATSGLSATSLSLPMPGMDSGKVLTSDMFGNASWATPRGESFRYDQASPAATWSVTHPLGREPNDVAVWVDGSRVYCDVDIPGPTTVVLTFGVPVSGYVTIT